MFVEPGLGTCVITATEAQTGCQLGSVPLYVKSHLGPNDGRRVPFSIKFERDEFPNVHSADDVLLSAVFKDSGQGPRAFAGSFVVLDT
jgi:hypothetical protein